MSNWTLTKKTIFGILIFILLLDTLIIVGNTGGNTGKREPLTVYHDECIDVKYKPVFRNEFVYFLEKGKTYQPNSNITSLNSIFRAEKNLFLPVTSVNSIEEVTCKKYMLVREASQ